MRCKLDRLWLGALRRVLGFDAWHASAPYSCRPYKRLIVKMADSVTPSVVVEVGCGLGDIVSRVKARERFGFDTDTAVVTAARCLHPLSTRWIHGDTASVARVIPAQHRIDCLIMVNWIHNLSPEQLAACVLPLLPRVGFLILDALDADAPASYCFRHDFGFLAGLAERVAMERSPGEPRRFEVYRVVR